MTYFLKRGNQFRTTAEANIDISKELPVGTYSVNMDMEGFYLETIEEMPVEGKIYGDAELRADRIINTFDDRPATTGILLEGEKGSGKTFLAKLLAQKLLTVGVPTILVNGPFAGEAFNNFIASIKQPCLIFFDEFEKVYKPETQAALLTLLDGTYSSKKLFVVALNDTYRLVDYFKNRPGRFFYRFKYAGLDEQFIRDYCDDRLNNKDHINNIVLFASTFSAFNFDILKAMVEEMNRYNEGVAEVTKFLNATPVSISAKYQIEDFKLRAVKPRRGMTPPKFKSVEKLVGHGMSINPLQGGWHVTWTCTEDYDRTVLFQPEDLVKVSQRQMTFENDSAAVTISPYVNKKADIMETLFAGPYEVEGDYI